MLLPHLSQKEIHKNKVEVPGEHMNYHCPFQGSYVLLAVHIIPVELPVVKNIQPFWIIFRTYET